MEELVQSITLLAEKMESKTPIWVSIIVSLVPIILTVLTIIISYRNEKHNKELQKLIHNRDVFIQSRQDILSIYNAYSEALFCVHRYENVETVFIDEQTTYLWNQEINNTLAEVFKSCDKAKLLFDDKDLTDYLTDVRNKYQEICCCVSRYVYNNTFIQVLQNARSAVSTQFAIPANNPFAILQNTPAREQLIKLCTNENTREISKHISTFSDMMSDEKFDSKFKKYLLIRELSTKSSE